jgi:hypothetical protein
LPAPEDECKHAGAALQGGLQTPGFDGGHQGSVSEGRARAAAGAPLAPARGG